MELDVDSLQRLLCERLCEDVRISARPDGALMLTTHFEFPDGDKFPIHIAATEMGGVRLSDSGHTLMHISYDHDIDSFLEGTRRQLLERLVEEAGLGWDNGEFSLDTSIAKLPEAIFRFGQVLTRIYDLALPFSFQDTVDVS